MKDNKVLWSVGKNNECYTPVEGVIPILKYIPSGSIVWTPFDTVESHFVKEISKTHRVIHSHISEGKDFYSYQPEKWDVMVSNPPFTNKRAIFERVLSFNKPFALLMSLTWLNDGAPYKLFKGRDLQLLIPDKRIKFVCPNGIPNKKITFKTGYYCWNFLPKQIVMEPLL